MFGNIPVKLQCHLLSARRAPSPPPPPPPPSRPPDAVIMNMHYLGLPSSASPSDLISP